MVVPWWSHGGPWVKPTSDDIRLQRLHGHHGLTVVDFIEDVRPFFSLLLSHPPKADQELAQRDAEIC